ncbi:MAG: glycosyltransferase family 1 protein [Patescibacteria group bacterium]|nr:glycosyltransferase family 1 protein [Patescibacteria group bacterium]
MRIGINASFIRKPDSGTGQVTKHFINALFSMIESDPEKYANPEFILYLEEDINISVPKNVGVKIFLPPYKRDDLIRKIWWEKYLLPKKAAQDGCNVLLSLYQSATVVKNMKHVMLVHDAAWKCFPQYLNNMRKKIYYGLVDRAIKKASHIMTVSSFSKKEIEKYFYVENEKITVNYIDCDPIFKEEYSNETLENILKKHNLKKGYIFYVGGFDIRKNISRLIDAYAKMWKKYGQTIAIPKLVLAGSFHFHLIPLITDIPDEIKKAGKKYGLPEKKIEYINFVEPEDLPLLYRGASLFCYPSLYEGFGLPVLEAMNSQCPVVSSDASSIPEVTGKETVLLVDPKDSDAICEAMYNMITDKQKRGIFTENTKKRAKKFNWNIFVENTFNIIHEITK